jgi:uncharacterized membrane protein YvlD (DUF360 family)
MQYLYFLGAWFLNFLILLGVWLYGGQIVVLGNASLNSVVAAIVTSFLLAAIVSLIKPVLRELKVKIENENYKILILLVINIFGLWILARLAAYTGFGIVRFWVAIVLGVILTILHWALGKYVLPKLPAKKA